MRLTLAAFSLLTGIQIAAQEPARDRGFGRVTGSDGKPWVGAEVHLLHRSHKALTDPAFGEHLVLQSDDKGEFRAGLLAGCSYQAWAVGPLTADSGYRVTPTQANCVARTPILLVEGERHFVRRLRPDVHASWKGREPLRWLAVMNNPRQAEWLQPDADGVLSTPRSPGSYIELQAWAGDWLAMTTGFPIVASMAIQSGLQWRATDKPTAADADARLAAVHTFAVRERLTREITLRDAGNDAPIAAAEVRLDRMPDGVAPTRSDDKGVVHAVFAAGEQSPNVPGSWTILPPAANAEFALNVGSYKKNDPPVTTRKLPSGRRLDGRLQWSADEPAGGVALLVEGSVDNGNGIWFGIDARVFVTAADGRFAIPGRTDGYPFRLSLALSPAMRARLAKGDDPAPVAPIAVLRWDTGALPESLGDIELGELVAFDIQVRQEDGLPPGCTHVLLKSVAGGTAAPRDPVAVHTDHRGRARVMLPSTAGVLVHATTERGADWQQLETDQRSVELTIDPRYVMRFRVVDAAGQPIPDASVNLVTTGFGFAAGPAHDAIRDMCVVHAFPRKNGRAGADGVGTLVAPVLGSSLDLAITVSGREAKRVHVSWNGPEGDGPVGIVVR